MDKGLRKVRASEHKTLAKKGTNLGVGFTLIGDGLSATLRMVIPTIGLFSVGLAIDAYLEQTVFYGLIGAGLGFVVAAFLIYHQAIRLIAASKLSAKTKEDEK